MNFDMNIGMGVVDVVVALDILVPSILQDDLGTSPSLSSSPDEYYWKKQVPVMLQHIKMSRKRP